MLFLSDEDVRRLLTMKEAIEAVRKAFAEFTAGSALMPPRATMMLKEYDGSISLMPSYLRETGIAATKVISIYPKNPSRGLPTSTAHIIVNNPETGKTVALIEASHLTAMRTGAVTGVAGSYLARKDSEVAAVIGCGIQGQTQASAIKESSSVETLLCYDVSREKGRAFSQEMSRRLGMDAVACETAEDAVREADIIATATTSRDPVIRRQWLKQGVFVSAIGSFYPDHREIDSATVRDAKVVVDSKEAVLAEAGDIIIPINERVITEDHIYAELGELVTGSKEGRTSSDNVTLFKSVGLAIQDSSVAALVIRKWMHALG